MNAILGDRYCTIHLTPQYGYSYVSLETNANLGDIIAIPLDILRPHSFDLILYQPESRGQIVDAIRQHYRLQHEQYRWLIVELYRPFYSGIDCKYHPLERI